MELHSTLTHKKGSKIKVTFKVLAASLLISTSMMATPSIMAYAAEAPSVSQGITYAREFGSLEELPASPSYEISFSDVLESDWFYTDVMEMARAGVINGMSDGTFSPMGELTVSAAIKLAVTARNAYYGEATVQIDPNSDHWVDSYFDYAASHGLFSDVTFSRSEFDSPISRGQMAALFANVLHPSDYPAINDIDRAENPAIRLETNKHAIFLYNSGILIGTNEGFELDKNISRAETAAIINRVVNPDARKDTGTFNRRGTSGTVEDVTDQVIEGDFTAYQLETIDLVNSTRAELGLEPMILDEELCRAAEQLALEYSQGSDAHYRLNGDLTISVLPELGLRIRPIKENYADGTANIMNSTSRVHEGWMKSEGHRGEIVSKSHKYMGIGKVEANGNVYWVAVYSPN